MNQERPRSRMRDFWQLDVPLVIALALCTTFTIIEVNRAAEGVWRAWVYMVEWPMIGAFCVWMWVRFKREPGGGFARQWRERATRMAHQAEDEDPTQDAGNSVRDSRGPDPRGAGPREFDPQVPDDPELAAWQEYQRKLRAEQDRQP